MIFLSKGQDAAPCDVCRTPWRVTPIMAIHRSTLSRRSILFLFVLLGTPVAAQCDAFEDSARELATKIAEKVPARSELIVSTRNSSSLATPEVERIAQTLKLELRRFGMQVFEEKEKTSGESLVIVTFSESFKDFVWSAEIRRPGLDTVVLVTCPRPVANYGEPGARKKLTLRGERFWQGTERVLDAGEISNSRGRTFLVLLMPDALLIRDAQTRAAMRLDIPASESTSRDPRGKLDFATPSETVGFLAGHNACIVNLEAPNLNQCLKAESHSDAPFTGRFPFTLDLGHTTPPVPGKGFDLSIGSMCGENDLFLVSGGHDYTQPDSVQVYEQVSGGPEAVSEELNFSGPLLELHSATGESRAIVHNLSTGNYEAYHLHVLCSN